MNILYITYFLNGFLMIAMPVVLAIYLTRRWKLSWRFWFVGAAVFIISQMGHIPFLYWLTALFQNHVLPAPPAAYTPVFNAVLLGLLAGLFEELCRYAMFRWWLKDARSWRKAVLAGAGHGGAEAIILGALVLTAYVYYSFAQNNPAALAALPAAQVQAIHAYWSAPWYASLLGAFERAMTIPVQITFSVIVLQTFIRKQWFWVWLAVLFHALIDTTTVLVMPAIGAYWTEALVAVFCAVSLLILFRLRSPEPPEPQPAPVSPLPDVAGQPVAETPQNLDASKFQ